MDALAQWNQGIVYPRWAASPHWGYGEARFVFYPPASWMLGAALGSVLPWKVVPGAYCWLALMLAGTGMYRLARRWLQAADALFAAAFYAINPYHLLVIYWRSAYAELLGAALVPLLVLVVFRLHDASLRPAIWLGLLLGGAWLINVPLAVMMHYSAAALALLLAARERSARSLLRLAFAVLLGAGLAGFYLIPALYEQRWVNIAAVLSPGVRPQDNFLFTRTADVDHAHFNWLISLMGLAEMVVLGCAAYFSRRTRKASGAWTPLVLWGGGAALLQFSVSWPLWRYLPELLYVQLPFRWLLCLNVAVAVLLAMACNRLPRMRWATRAAVWVALVAVLLLVGWRTQMPWWATSSDFDDMQQSVDDGSGNEGVDEYVPVGTDPYELKKDLPRLSDDRGRDVEISKGTVAAGQEHASAVRAEVTRWGAEQKWFHAFASRRADITVRLFNYPAWEATVNGHRVATATTEVTGLMVVPLDTGENDVEIRFTRTRDRWWGNAVSALSLAVLAIAGFWTRSKPLATMGQ